MVPVDFVSNQDGGTHAEYASDHLCNLFCLPYKWPPTSVTAKRASAAAGHPVATEARPCTLPRRA